MCAFLFGILPLSLYKKINGFAFLCAEIYYLLESSAGLLPVNATSAGVYTCFYRNNEVTAPVGEKCWYVGRQVEEKLILRICYHFASHQSSKL